MKTLLLLVIFFTLYTQSTHSQWVLQTLPISGTPEISGIEFVDSLRGWACDYKIYSHIFATTNGGTNWIVQDTIDGYFRDIDMINATTGFAIATMNLYPYVRLYRTIDGGSYWSSLNHPDFWIGQQHKIFFLNSATGYYCSDKISGISFYKTASSGSSWVLKNTGLTGRLRSLFFVDVNTGFCGTDSLLFKTTNAAETWQQVNNFGHLVKSIYFINANTGWVGANSSVYFTSNGGTNWNNQFIGTSPSEMYFYNEFTGYGVFAQNIYHTFNGGINWSSQNDPNSADALSFVDPYRGWKAGISGISRTTNGGGFLGISSISTEIPSSFKLYQNYPNPFNPVTTIRIDIPNSANVKLIILDILGRELHEEKEYLMTGSYEFNWDAADYSSGTYFYRLITEKYTETKKMLLVK